MAEAKRRGYGEDGIYFDHRDDCRDSAHHKICSGRWRGVVSLGYAADGKRIRKKVSGQTRGEVKDKLKALHSELDAGVRTVQELDAGVRTVQGYTVEAAVTDWLAEGLPGRAAKTVEVYRDALRPVLAVVGRIPLRDLTVQDVRTAMAKMAVTHSAPTLQKAHNCLTRALRHAEGRDLVRRNVSALVNTLHGREGRPSQALTVEQAAALLEAAEDSRLHAYIVLCLRTSFVSMMSYQGVPVEEIARLAGHASSRTTEVVDRRELRPVITTGAEIMDQIFQPKQRQGAHAEAAG